MDYELSTWVLGALDRERAEAHWALRDGWVIDEEGALLLRSQLGSYNHEQGPDLTGFEATHNHIHIDLETPREPVGRLMLWAEAVEVLYEGLRGATEAAGGRRCVGIAGLGGIGEGATVRWHLDRGVRWLSEDLEGFELDAVLVIGSEDLDPGSLAIATVAP
jgi:hypothetical protein